jgi:hypothetical protein
MTFELTYTSKSVVTFDRATSSERCASAFDEKSVEIFVQKRCFTLQN